MRYIIMSEEQPEIVEDTETQTTAPTPEIITKIGDIEVPEKFRDTSAEGILQKVLPSYTHLETKSGSTYSLPTEDSSEEKWQEFNERVLGTGRFIERPQPDNPEALDKLYSQLGRPEESTGYDVKFNEKVNEYVDPGALERYKQLAHGAGLTNNQAQFLVDFESERMLKELTQRQEQTKKVEQVLRENWGAEFDNRMEGAKVALKTYQAKYPDAVQEILNGSLGSNPALVSMLSDLGDSLREKGHVGAVNLVPNGPTAEEARAKIAEIHENRKHAFNTIASNSAADIAAHDEAVKKMEELYKIAYPPIKK